MVSLTCDVPVSLGSPLKMRALATRQSESQLVIAALSQHLAQPIHTLFQVSTSGALVAGVYSGVVSCTTILQHGDFGLGTFAKLDGEMVVLDGRVYRIQGSGRVTEAARDAEAPFAVVTWFEPETEVSITDVSGYKALEAQCDLFRRSGNIFYAVRLDGHFRRVRTRAVNPPQPGTRLAAAAKAQSEFGFSEIDGSLIGLWSPGFSSAFSVAGYHFHFLSDDRCHGGHVLDVQADKLQLKIEPLTDFRLALPESESFLKADLSKSTAEELAYAEQAH
jgi:acetolactate decarboxylase